MAGPADEGRRLGRTQSIALVALAVGTYSIADGFEASGFLAVWVAGLATGVMIRGHVDDEAFHLPERAADVLAAVGFLLLGAGLIAPILARATPITVVYAMLSLTAGGRTYSSAASMS